MPDPELRVRVAHDAIELPLHVQPRARRNEIAGIYNGALKLKLIAPPVDDAANKALIQFFATLLGLPKSRLKISSGERSREKILRIEGMSRAELFSHLPPGLR